MIKKYLFAISLFVSNVSMAQQEIQYTMYRFNNLLFNPAAAGSRDALTAVAASTGPPVDAADTPSTVSPAGTDLKLTKVSSSKAAASTPVFEPVEIFIVFDVETPTRATVARVD